MEYFKKYRHLYRSISIIFYQVHDNELINSESGPVEYLIEFDPSQLTSLDLDLTSIASEEMVKPPKYYIHTVISQSLQYVTVTVGEQNVFNN